VINVDRGHVCRRDDFEFVDGIFDLCRAFQQEGYLLVVVTNQGGIGRGYYSEQNFLALTGWMLSVFREQGISIAKVYYCPFHPEHGIGAYRLDSFDRKPNPGMLLRARDELQIDLEASVLVGDKESDIEAARRAGIGMSFWLGGSDARKTDPPEFRSCRSPRDVIAWLIGPERADRTPASASSIAP
jgi:D-glycero-D-manno-heptose 1,7-bisphosphate phosphatase